jgi:hypothetical protein
MAEQYICKQILPKKNKEEYYTLKNYNKLLEGKSKEVSERERNSIIIMLYQFAVYLSYVSTGAPKKITNYFEKYVVAKEEIKGKVRKLPHLTPKKPEYYLAFKYREQQKIGFVHYMAFPLVNAILNNASRYGDKLLISGCFLTNHIYKYHNNGFSWRNLENIPELLDVNKSPELREFINIIIAYLKRSHLSSTINSLYHFKFPMKIAEEISLMSRLSEEISALFNFTLDDSLSVKRHYSKLLDYYISKQNNSIEGDNKLIINTSQDDLHHVIAGIHQILGDLHLLDEEYNEAVFEYQCCIQILQKDKINNDDAHFPSHILSIVRVMLKLCLTYEKRKTYNTAYITYNELISKLVQFRYIDQSKLGLQYEQKFKDEATWKDRTDILYKSNIYYQNSEFEKKIQPAIVGCDPHFKVDGEELILQLNRQLTPEKNTLISRLSLFEDINLIYQPLLARLFVLEKKGLSGITKENIDILESDFLYLHRSVYYEDKYMISADFFRKLADILYYKNGLINQQSCNFFMSLYLWDYNVEKDIHDYCTKNGFENYEDIKKILNAPFPRLYVKDNDKDKEKEEAYIVIMEGNEAIKDFINSPQFRRLNREICFEVKSGKVEKVKKGKPDKFVSVEIYNEPWKVKETNDTGTNDRETEWIKANFLIIRENDSNKQISFKKIHYCQKRRVGLLNGDIKSVEEKAEVVSNKRTPCYACKYYNRSLKIIIQKMIQDDEKPKNDHPISKAIFFLEKIDKKEQFKTLKENDLLILASSLDGLGNVLFSCSCKEDEITFKFMEKFVKLIDMHREGKDENPAWQGELSYLEKALLYFWAAASYYKYSSNMKEAYLCYKKIMHLFVAYLEMHQDDKDKNKFFDAITDNLENIKKNIFSRAIQNLYSQYENTNMVEIQKLKWIFTKEMYQSIQLNMLSIFPDIEEMILLYGQMELLLDKLGKKDKHNPIAANVYQSMNLSPFRVENTISERIVSLRFKADVNMRILDKLLKYRDKNHIYDADFSIIIYQNYLSYINENKSLQDQLDNYKNFFNEKDLDTNDTRTRIEFIEFLLLDTIFALSKIVETISPTTQTTLFSESYLGNIYSQLYECNQIYEFIYLMYKWCEQKETNSTETELFNKIKTVYDDIKKLFETQKENEEKIKSEKLLDKIKMFYDDIKKLFETQKTTIGTNNENIYDQLYECNGIYEFIYLMYKWCEQEGTNNTEIETEKTKSEDLLDKIKINYNDIKNKLLKIQEENKKKTTGNIFNQLYECNDIYEFIYLMHKWCEQKDTETKDTETNKTTRPLNITETELIDKIKSFHDDRLKEDKEYGQKNVKLLDGIKEIIHKEMKIEKKDKESQSYSEKFFKKFMEHIDRADVHNNITNYHAEMALKKFRRASEMHREGSAYQEMISNVYFLEDDLNNNTYQFYFAIERYYNNCGYLNEIIKTLKSICQVSTLLKMEKYVGEPFKLERG